MERKKEETMNENKTTTYGELKVRKQELRNKGVVTCMEEYLQNMNTIKDAEAVLLWSISEEEKYGVLEQARRKKFRTGAIVCFVVAGIAAVILAVALMGCSTLKGMGNDGAWILQTAADNIRTEK